MQPSTTLQPRIRVAHYYEFPSDIQDVEDSRFGYCYAFHLIKSGRGRIQVPGRTFMVTKGDLVFFPPRLRHAFLSDGEQPLATYNIYCELWLPSPIASHRHLFRNDSDYDASYLTAIQDDPAIGQLPAYLPLQHHETLSAIFEHIVHHHQNSEPSSTPIAEGLLHVFILELLQLALAPLLTDYRIRPIMAQIDQEAKAGRHFETWLALSGLKKTQFHHLFKKATGLSPKAYWTRAIMKQAAAALKESNRSITDIAYDFGYSSIHHFTKQFTAFYGVAPSVYRHRKE